MKPSTLVTWLMVLQVSAYIILFGFVGWALVHFVRKFW